MSRLRVVQLTPDLGPGGAQRVVLHLAAALDARRHAVSVVSLFDGGDPGLRAALAATGLPVYTLGKHRGPDVRMLWRLRRLLRTLQPDVLHTHRYALRYAWAACPKPAPFPIVHTVHNLAQYEVGSLDRALFGRLFRRGRVLPVAIAEAVRASMEATYGAGEYPVIYNGIVEEDVEFPVRLPGSAPLQVFSVGRLSAQKNPLLLVEAFADGPVQAGLDATLTLVGEGPLRPALQARITALGLGARVRLLGQRDDVPALLAQADLWAAGSDYEGHPLALIEAMAAGLPVVATAVGGVPEVVTPDTGRCVPPDDKDALAQALVEALTDAAWRLEAGSQGRRRARGLFGAAAMAAHYAEWYARLTTAPHQTAHTP